MGTDEKRSVGKVQVRRSWCRETFNRLSPQEFYLYYDI
jgi:hypothetical protein